MFLPKKKHRVQEALVESINKAVQCELLNIICTCQLSKQRQNTQGPILHYKHQIPLQQDL